MHALLISIALTSEKFLCSIEGDEYRNMQLVNLERKSVVRYSSTDEMSRTHPS